MTTTPTTSREALSRRRLLGTALTVGAAGAVGAALPLATTTPARAATAPAATAPARAATTPARSAAATATGSPFALPEPTGPHPVGTVELELVDGSRPDPDNPGRFRRLMASVWYPARGDVDRYPLAPWMHPDLLRVFLADGGYPADLVGPLTSGHLGAPVHRTGRGLPVVLFSHGAHDHRADHTVIVQELASHGFAVVTVDHTWDAYSRLPDGRLLTPVFDRQHMMGPKEFAADLHFLVDCVEQLAAGQNPDAERRPLPAGLTEALDASRIGAFGWSKGGTATAYAMLGDQRIKAGLSLDAPMQPLITADLDRPFLMMTASFPRAQDPAAEQFWGHLKGWRLNVQAEGAVHSSYGDTEVFVAQAATLLGISPDQVPELIGTIDPARAVRIQQAYPLAFFGRHLCGHRSRLLDGPSRDFPEVTYLP
ncbi:acetylhydrolase [Kitasatospora sp. MMS16-BH015]|uniref:alpha/beta hydrolase family protein n=1 Tax=Kitasatospora sp. MMS16-BH015 TaxID=2018025 RepID=UPI000CA1E398|nr:acetylhydrolase [Kitasatospora sp. MMS16-BH015]AUG77416.1 acetylhydrolase [Kitasatospora sp. MMS16-BH015]